MTHSNFELIMIDDDELFLVLNKRESIKSGFHTEPKTFLSTQPAMDYLISLAQTDKKVLVFLDINMPEMDGWEFLTLLRKQQLKNNIKHIVVTSSTDPKDKIIANEFPEIIGFLEKPITKQMLLDLQKEQGFKSFLEA